MAIKINLTQVGAPKSALPSDNVDEEKEVDLAQLIQQEINKQKEELDKVRQSAEKEGKEKGLEGEELESFIKGKMDTADLGDILSRSLENELADMNLTVEEKAMFKTSLIFYLQGRIDNHLQDILPDEFFAWLDEGLEKNEIGPEEVVGVVMIAYQGLTKQTIQAYATALLQDILPQFKEIFRIGQADLDLYATLEPGEQEQFVEFLREGDFDAAEDLMFDASQRIAQQVDSDDNVQPDKSTAN